MLMGTVPETATAKGTVATTSRSVKIQRTPRLREGSGQTTRADARWRPGDVTDAAGDELGGADDVVRTRLLLGGVDDDGDVEPSRDT